MSPPEPKKQKLFLVSIRINSSTRDARRFVKHLAECAEQYYTLNHLHDGTSYDLNLSRWEEI